jgi:transposase
MAHVFGKSKESRERYWREHIRTCEASGKSIAQYCRDIGVSTPQYHWWKRELKRRGGKRISAPLFAEVRPAFDVPPAEPPVLEVVLAQNRVVRVPRGFDAVTLSAVVHVLENLSC